MTRLLCFFLGHDWQPRKPAEIDQDYRRFHTIHLACCKRCGEIK